MAHLSDSTVQQEAELLIRHRVAEHVGKALRVDGVAADESVFVEIFAHQGALKGGQRHKVATDALKLITIGRSRPDAELILAFGDDAAAFATKGTWMSVALVAWGVKVVVVELDDSVRDDIQAAQVRQVMVNPTTVLPPRSQHFRLTTLKARSRCRRSSSEVDASAVGEAAVAVGPTHDRPGQEGICSTTSRPIPDLGVVPAATREFTSSSLHSSITILGWLGCPR
jgi:hypothetical protein